MSMLLASLKAELSLCLFLNCLFSLSSPPPPLPSPPPPPSSSHLVSDHQLNTLTRAQVKVQALVVEHLEKQV